MQTITHYPIFSFVVLMFCILMMSACSNSNRVTAAFNTNNSNKTVPSKPVKLANKKLAHVHQSNSCTAALAHSHLYKSEEHQHRYDCENTNKFVANAHVHEATKISNKFRHVHPNGVNKHSHH